MLSLGINVYCTWFMASCRIRVVFIGLIDTLKLRATSIIKRAAIATLINARDVANQSPDA